MRHPILRSLQALFFALLVLAGRSAAAQARGQATAPTEGPLGTFAAQKVVVMPVQFLRVDSLSPVKAADWPNLRKEIDDSIGVTIAERGIGKKWTYAADVARMAKRNAGYVNDPYTLGAGGLRMRVLKAEEQAPRVMLDNLRGFVALGDARYALVPVELMFEKKGTGHHALLRVVMLDARAGQVVWFADLDLPDGKPATIGQRVADLVSR